MNYQRIRSRMQSLGLVAALLAVNFFTTLWLQGQPISTAWASVLGQDAPPAVTAAGVTAVTIPATFNYQGYVRNSDGTLETGTHTIRAIMYTDAVGGTVLHDETQENIPVRDGLFNIVLGDKEPFAPDLFLNHAPLYLGVTLVTLDNGQELIPRQRLHAVPWALTASTLTPNATVNGLTNNGPTALNGPTTLNGAITSAVTMSGSVTMKQDVTVKAIREIGDAAGNKTDADYNMSLRRYTLEAKDGGASFNSVPVDDAILQQLCADEDGCTLRLGLREYAPDLAGTEVVAGFHPTHFSLGKADSNGRRFWRSEGDDFNGNFFFFTRADNDQSSDSPVSFAGCNLTDGTFQNGANQGDGGTGFSLFNQNPSNTNLKMTCVLTIDD